MEELYWTAQTVARRVGSGALRHEIFRARLLRAHPSRYE